MESPKRHHFVPRWYLEKFVDPETGFLHVYDKITERWRRQKPREVMTINRYYQQKHAPEGVDPDIFEKGLGSTLEPEAKTAFEKLLTRPKDVTAEDTAAILVYLELQRLRVPRQAETAKQLLMTTLLLHGPSEVVSAIMRKEITVKVNDAFRFDFMRMLTGSLHPYFARMEWEVVKAKAGYFFVTSDSPVSFFNVALPPPHEPGPALVGTMVFFPLNSQHLLILQHPEYVGNKTVSPLETIPDPQLEKGRIRVTSGTEWDEEQVKRLNWTMLQLSDRIIVGRSKEALETAIDIGTRATH
jgi:hypothetical protein